jgi:hypothetical protein
VGGKGAAMLFPQDAVERSMKVRYVMVRAIAGHELAEGCRDPGPEPPEVLLPVTSTERRSCGPVLTRAGPTLFSPLYAGRWFLVRAGLSRRQLGWRGDLCAGVLAASGTGVPALPPGRAATSRSSARVYPERFAKQHDPLRPVVERLLRTDLVRPGRDKGELFWRRAGS